MSRRSDTNGGEFIIEFIQMGKSIKATAFDPVTLTEASIIGPTNATHDQLSELAVRKLLYVMGRRDTP